MQSSTIQKLRILLIADRTGEDSLASRLRSGLSDSFDSCFLFQTGDAVPWEAEWDLAFLGMEDPEMMKNARNLLRQENPGIRILRIRTTPETGSELLPLQDDFSDQIFSKEDSPGVILDALYRFARIAEQIRTWKKERYLLNEYRSAVDAGSILSITDPRGVIIYANDNFCRISGYTYEELIGKPHNIIRHPDMPREAFADMWKTIKDRKVWKGVVKNRKKDGSSYIVNTTVSPVLDEDGKVVEYVSLRSDITDLVREKERTLRAATVDSVTDCLNRYSLQQRISGDHTFDGAVINLNGFSQLNDFYGELAGDSLLKQIARLLHSIFVGNFQIYRAGADEFVILSDRGSDLLNLTIHAVEEIRTRDFPFDNRTFLHVAATAGVALASQDPYREALTAFQHARMRKEPCVVYSKKLDRRARHRQNVELSSRVIRGIIHNRIQPFYQPIVELDTGRIHKSEALLRLVCEDGVIVSPVDTIRIARMSGQYRDLTHAFLRRIFEHLNTDNEKRSISVNLSFDDLSHESTVELILDYLKRGSFGNRITFEITEAEDMDDFELVKSFIDTVKNHGALCAIDDFGSGYSNFVNLLELDADYLKIDGSLVESLPHGGKTRKIISFIADFARFHGMKTVGEYVSTGELVDMLKDIGVDYGQGFFLGKPLPRNPGE